MRVYFIFDVKEQFIGKITDLKESDKIDKLFATIKSNGEVFLNKAEKIIKIILDKESND